MRRSAWKGALAALVALGASNVAFAAPEDDDARRPLSFDSYGPLQPRQLRSEFYVDNHDRDPLGADVFDVGLRFRLGLGERHTLFFDAVLDRVISMPDVPPLPPPPRDVVVVGGPTPAGAFMHSFVGPYPYVDKRGTARFSAFVPGKAKVGFTRLLRSSESGHLSASAGLIAPMSRSFESLQSGSSTGGIDFEFGVSGSQALLGGRGHARGAFVLVGSALHPDRVLTVAGSSVAVEALDLPLGNRFDGALAWARDVRPWLTLSIEARTEKEFAPADRIDASTPVDLILGAQFRRGRFVFRVAGLRQVRALESGAARANPLGGAIDLTNVSDADLAPFLSRLGATAVAGQFRGNSHRVLFAPSPGTLPRGAVVIPGAYSVRSEHQNGYVISVTFDR